MILAEVASYLVTQGVFTGQGTTGGATPLFTGKLPAQPDVCGALMEYGGKSAEFDLGRTAIRLEFPRFQLICRGVRDDYAGPRQLAQNAFIQLSNVINQTLSGVRYLTIDGMQSPFFLRRDTNDRVEIVCNYEVMKASTAS